MMDKVYKCIVSGKSIPSERVEALQMLGIPESRWTCVEHALPIPRKGIYLGEAGTSELLIVDKVYDDSVRSVFRGVRKEAAQDKEIDEEDVSVQPYNEKEMNYYAANDDVPDPEEKI